jgi:hypothetical protein
VAGRHKVARSHKVAGRSHEVADRSHKDELRTTEATYEQAKAHLDVVKRLGCSHHAVEIGPTVSLLYCSGCDPKHFTL